MTERWNFVELRELCNQRGLDYPIIYTSSLELRQKRAGYHAEAAQKVWKELLQHQFSTNDQLFRESVFIYEANTEACVQALHSLGDILAQIINVIVLPQQKQFSEKKVTLYKVYDLLKKEQLVPDIVEEIDVLQNSYAFKYIDGFCNTIKHRRLVNTNLAFEITPSKSKGGLRFQSFSYEPPYTSSPENYPMTWGSDIFNNHLVDIVKHCNNVGLKINEYLR